MPRELVVESALEKATMGYIDLNGKMHAETPFIEVEWGGETDEVNAAHVRISATHESWDFVARMLEFQKGVEFPNWRIKLTRQQINHMIRTLRRARNATFGSDE